MSPKRGDGPAPVSPYLPFSVQPYQTVASAASAAACGMGKVFEGRGLKGFGRPLLLTKQLNEMTVTR